MSANARSFMTSRRVLDSYGRPALPLRRWTPPSGNRTPCGALTHCPDAHFPTVSLDLESWRTLDLTRSAMSDKGVEATLVEFYNTVYVRSTLAYSICILTTAWAADTAGGLRICVEMQPPASQARVASTTS